MAGILWFLRLAHGLSGGAENVRKVAKKSFPPQLPAPKNAEPPLEGDRSPMAQMYKKGYLCGPHNKHSL